MMTATLPGPAWDTSAFFDHRSMSPAVNFAGYGVAADHFRFLAASLPTGVNVITTSEADRTPVGMTSGAVCGVSCEPPLLLTCIGRGSRTLEAIKSRKRFCVNVLSAAGSHVSEQFARSQTDKFAGVTWVPAYGGIPVLTQDTIAHAICELYQVHSAGDHAIVIGLIVDGAHRSDVSPLMYFRRGYSGFPLSQTE
jgi:flavin reductase (DIM6/NTAB) family NADH-FMN oxidoreductase RutF